MIKIGYKIDKEIDYKVHMEMQKDKKLDNPEEESWRIFITKCQ